MPIILSPSQETTCEAFRDFLLDDSQTEFLISGFAGSGKSFLVKYLVEMAQREYKLAKLIDPALIIQGYHFTATTNKAAYVLSNMLQTPTNTIHKLLGLTVQNNFKTGKVNLVKKNDCADLNHTIVFIDEASMITRELLGHIQGNISKHTNCKIVYIGDSYQLPPVKEVLCPIFQTDINNNFLSDIQRQVAGSPIIQLSTKYREMLDDHTLEWPEITDDGKIVFHYTDKEKWFDAIRTAYKAPHLPDDLRVLAWSNDRIHEYNRWIRSFKGETGDFAIGEIVQTNKPLIRKSRILAPTDSIHRILAIESTVVDDIPGYNITINGIDSGNSCSVYQPIDWREANQLASQFAKDKNWTAFFEIKDEWADLRPIHAQTVHKSQGSTYREVFIDLSNIGKNNKWQEVARLVYVAITRASHRVHLFGQLQNRYTKKPIKDLMEAFRHGA